MPQYLAKQALIEVPLLQTIVWSVPTQLLVGLSKLATGESCHQRELQCQGEPCNHLSKPLPLPLADKGQVIECHFRNTM